MKISPFGVSPSLLHVFWSEPTPETIKDCIIIAAGSMLPHTFSSEEADYHIKHLSLDKNQGACFPPFPQNTDETSMGERR